MAKSDLFTVPKEGLAAVRQQIKGYNDVLKEREAQEKRDRSELARLTRKIDQLEAIERRLNAKKKRTAKDEEQLAKVKLEVAPLQDEWKDLHQRVSKLTSTKQLEIITPVWVPVGNVKVLMKWEIIAPLNKLLRNFRVMLVTNSTQSHLEVRYFHKKTRGGTTNYELKGTYWLNALTGTVYDRFGFGAHAPTCSIPEWVDTRVN
ncbi:hypothetical protein [Tumebacillus flagellatus]|uniref:Uncharacterized protein n=1 Tax=Tumebacillus flagellatus TaxID=1157490 RepID=A0A074LRL2_9BACL|nr:hypothetical protein [Tumebacillus flagellatus]KEO84781.1 hypothetical protein EL26_01860 [Tumebacillus flagellatus]